MSKKILFLVFAIAMAASIVSACDGSALAKVFKMTNVQILPEVPKVIQVPLVSVAMITDTGEQLTNPYGEYLGRIYADRVDLNKDVQSINCVYGGTESGDATIVLTTEDYIIFIKDATAPRVRYLIQVINPSAQRSLKFAIK